MTLDDIRTEPASEDAAAPGPFLIVSGHDFRTPRKVHLHHYAEEFTLRGKTRFFSIGFSWLSRLRQNTRVALWDRANRIETVDGVDCYLWRTALHPFNLRLALLDRAAEPLMKAYARMVPEVFLEWVKSSRFIMLESGLPVLLFELVKSVNPTAKIVYFASDGLPSIGCGQFLIRELRRTIGRYDAAFALSPVLATTFREHTRAYYVPYGAPRNIAANGQASPFLGGLNAVSAGQMRFDPSFFEIAAAAFPEVAFHVISGGPRAAKLKAHNIRLYDEMPVGEVLNYFRHATIGVAPYDDGGASDAYLVHSSQKLTQMGNLGTPAVCPQITAGNVPGRFGYLPGDRRSIVTAVRAALAAGRQPPTPAPSWSEVVDRLLAPELFADARV